METKRENGLLFKTGYGWRACYDEARNLYTAEQSFFGAGGGAYDLYEIDRETFDALDGLDDRDAMRLLIKGRHLYMDVNDKCGPPYTVVLDSDYQTLCPWANVICSGEVWPEELTDAAVEIFASEADNREQRRRKREARKAKEKQ